MKPIVRRSSPLGGIHFGANFDAMSERPRYFADNDISGEVFSCLRADCNLGTSTRRLFTHRYLTSLTSGPRQTRVSLWQPLISDRVQRCDFLAQVEECRIGHHVCRLIYTKTAIARVVHAALEFHRVSGGSRFPKFDDRQNPRKARKWQVALEKTSDE